MLFYLDNRKISVISLMSKEIKYKRKKERKKKVTFLPVHFIYSLLVRRSSACSARNTLAIKVACFVRLPVN